MVGFYVITMMIMLLATALMIRKLYDHLELKENRELLILVIGLFADLAGCIAMAVSDEITEMMLGYRILLTGRGLFGIGFILYYARIFRAKYSTKFILWIWNINQILCILATFIYRRDNIFLTNISIKPFYNISILSGERHILYFAHEGIVFLAGLWAVLLIVREYSKVKKQNDKLQKYVLTFFALGVLLQGISLAFYELGGFKYPDYTSVLRGLMAIIYSGMAAKLHFVSYESLARDTLLNDVGAGFIVLSNTYHIIYYNDIAAEVFPDLQGLEGVTPYSDAVKTAIDRRESEIQRGGNTYRITADRIFNKGKLAGYSLLIVNVTDYLLLEKQASVSRDAKEKLLTNMAHELRTPINAISGEAEMMLEGENIENYHEYAKNIQASVDRLNDAFNYLIEAFNEETEMVSPTDNPYNICVLLDSVIANCTKRAQKKDIGFETEIDPNLFTDAIGDDSSVYKLLMNIFTNAIRYTEKGKVFLKVTNYIGDNGECNYEFVLADTGEHAEAFYAAKEKNKGLDLVAGRESGNNRGISFILAKRLLGVLNGHFRMWTSEDNYNIFYMVIPQKISSQNTIMSLRMKDRMKVILLGNGKDYWEGLSVAMDKLGISYEYVSYMSRSEIFTDDKACLVFTELPKDNTKLKYNPELYDNCFTSYVSPVWTAGEEKENALVVSKPFSCLTLRRAFTNMDMIQGIDVESQTADFIIPSLRALVVDDEFLNRKVAVQILENFKIKADSVSSGYECLDLLNSGKEYDIIFMDYMMEGMNGIDTTIQIRSMKNNTDVKIVAFTANDVPGAKEKYFAAGMNGYLFKPAAREDFARVLRELVPKSLILEKVVKEAESDSDIDKIAQIEGINISQGLRYVAGNVETYKLLLVEFAKEIPNKVAKIKDFYAEKDWYDFTVFVHGVKSSSRMLGLEELGKQMAQLEVAGKTEDCDYVDSNLAEDLKLYESYLPMITALSKNEGDKKEHSSLYKLVAEIKSRVEEFETEDAEGLINELSSGNYGLVAKNDLEAINEAMKAADYYELLGCIDSLLGKIEAEENK